MIKKFLKFLAPDNGGDGGGAAAAVANPPAAGDGKPAGEKTPELTPGQKFHKSMAAAGVPPPPGTPKQSLPPVEAKPTEAKKPDKPAEKADDKKPKKVVPKSPVEAIAAGATKKPDAAAAKGNEAKDGDYLSDLPENLPDDKSEKSVHWTKARGAISTLGKTVGERDKRIGELERELQAARITPNEVVTERDKLKAEMDKYKDAITEINVELDPDFRKKFVLGRTEKVEKAATKLTAAGGDGDALKDALSMREGKARTMAIAQAMADAMEVDQTRIMNLVVEIENLDDEAGDVRKNSQVKWEERKQEMAKEEANKKAATEANKKTIFDRVGSMLSDALWPLKKLPADAEGATEWNAEVDAANQKAWGLAQAGVAPEEYAKAAFAYGAIDRFQGLLSSAYETIKELRAMNEAYENAQPDFRGGGGEQKTVHKTPAEKYHESMRQQRGE